MADQAITAFIESMVEGAVGILRLVGTWWMDAPGPAFGSDAVVIMRDNLQFFVWFFGVLGLLLAIGRLVVSAHQNGSAREGIISMGTLILNITLATGVYVALVPMLLTAGDSTAEWLLAQSTASENIDFATLAEPMAAAPIIASPGTAFLLALCLFLGAIANFLMMLVRDVLLLLLIVFIPVIAAASTTEAGRQSWKKANAYLMACLLMKPVAAGIYAFGFMLLTSTSDDFGVLLSSAITGILLLGMAGLVLPTLIRFLSPVVGAGLGGFSGAGVAGAALGIAAGAAILAGTGGAGA
ncbi:hypothetical protein HMPREF3102_05445, partial [Micrococcus sp. HMSC30C05]